MVTDYSQYNGLNSRDELSSTNVTVMHETQVRFYTRKSHMLHKQALLVITLIFAGRRWEKV